MPRSWDVNHRLPLSVVFADQLRRVRLKLHKTEPPKDGTWALEIRGSKPAQIALDGAPELPRNQEKRQP